MLPSMISSHQLKWLLKNLQTLYGSSVHNLNIVALQYYDKFIAGKPVRCKELGS